MENFNIFIVCSPIKWLLGILVFSFLYYFLQIQKNDSWIRGLFIREQLDEEKVKYLKKISIGLIVVHILLFTVDYVNYGLWPS